jgi:hypothetical protein
MFGWFKKKKWTMGQVDYRPDDGSKASAAANLLIESNRLCDAGSLLVIDRIMQNADENPDVKKAIQAVVAEWPGTEVEKLKHRLRFTDSVIRSGNVATMTADETEIMDIVLGVVEQARESAESIHAMAKSAGLGAAELERHAKFAGLCKKRAETLSHLVGRLKS